MVITDRNYASEFMTDANMTRVEALTAFAGAARLYLLDITLLDIAMSWIASRPLVASVIADATKPAQVEANVKAAAFQLSAEDLAELDTLTA